jgi:predicted aspartyl protease
MLFSSAFSSKFVIDTGAEAYIIYDRQLFRDFSTYSIVVN